MVRACPVCGSRRWKKDRVTGSTICEEGHVFQDFRSENLVTENVPYALQRRRERRGPRINKRKEHGKANQEYYHGADAEYLKVQALQLLLRLQVQALKKLWNLPDIFEAVVRDLWAYQLATTSDLEGGPGTARPAADEPAVSDNEKSAGQPLEEPDEDSSGEGNESQLSKTDTEDEDGVDPDILAELSDTSSKASDIGDASLPQAGKQSDTLREKKRRLRVSDTLSVLLLGLWILRIPILFADMENAVNGNRIPYIDFAHTLLLPTEMTKHMNRHVVRALSPSRSPSPLSLFERCRRLARTLDGAFGISLPECNLPPLVWRLVSQVEGTALTYDQVCRLLALLDVNLGITPFDVVTYMRRKQSRSDKGQFRPMSDREKLQIRSAARHNDIFMPEMTVMAAWVMTMKMAYGLDGEVRHVLLRDDPTLGLPEADVYVGELRRRLKDGKLRRERDLLEPQDFPNMALVDIDRYLDAAERVLLTDRDLETTAGPFPLIPADRRAAQRDMESWTDFHSERLRRVKLSDADTDVPNKHLPLMPGEKYRSFDSADITGTLPEAYEVVLGVAAQVAGVEPREMARVVESLERRMERTRQKLRRETSRPTSRTKHRERELSRSGSVSRAAGHKPSNAPSSRPTSRPPSRRSTRNRAPASDSE